MSSAPPSPVTASAPGPLRGEAAVPGDKSVSHRALILGTLAVGETTIEGLLEGEDVLRTAEAMRAFGATVERSGPEGGEGGKGTWRVHGLGTGGLLEPQDVIDCGNAGTGVRLIMGMMATCPITATFTGDASLRRRPMGRILTPLAAFGARSMGREGGLLPLALAGARAPVPVTYRLPVPSAQVKSAVLLAGLNAPGETVVIEAEATRDHTERMLHAFGAGIATEETAEGRIITLQGEAELRAGHVVVPRDPSSAAFPVAAALIAPSSEVLVPGICLNPTRDGFYRTLTEMGADIAEENARDASGEPVADLRVRHTGTLRGVEVPSERAPSMIDEYPVLACLAAFATGDTVMRGIRELRVKESDRIAAVVAGLRANGVGVTEHEDGMTVHGMGADGVPGGGTVETHLDHRIAMSFACLGFGAAKPVRIDDAGPIATSFPGFIDLMNSLGALIRKSNA
ncbi:MAG: 3-phosphoshikimate 1-carboxyvinyltransferase [Pseudomonadota bacterium]